MSISMKKRDLLASVAMDSGSIGSGEHETTEHEPEFAKDLLCGAKEIAEFLYEDGKGKRRKIYHLVATSNLPVFKLGSKICARKSVLLKWVRDQENRRAGECKRASPSRAIQR